MGDGLGAAAPLPAAFFDRPVLAVAPDLLGATVRHGPVVVRITEVEAYGGVDDPASHAARGPTPRSAVMFGPPGRAYVYLSYGVHWCVNIVCGPVGQACAVLLRAGEVVEGQALVRDRWPALSARDLARGPGRLGRVLGVGPALTGTPVTGGGPLVAATASSSPSAITPTHRRPERGIDAHGDLVPGTGRTAPTPSTAVTVIQRGPRIGIRAAAEWPWRFWLAGDPTVSGPRQLPRRP
ncbi:DNA-3-methyladenine glycosylase [Frankia sp. R82]|uniref:DNA-3-methyladenine glycosylase n=1 Tax=Frankia sp. R82 TaxID=2950553 RepID=UPI0020445AF3|nr:DNA-3-methyladenine glycosylase [Frankia sp. R82]MCM3887413.1 DNA-3-methyladenine glycosylase [Frankia sp. R82]